MKQSRMIAIAVFLAAALSVPVWATDPAQPGISRIDPARPGTLNYVEGQVSMGGQSLGPQAIGTTELSPGHSLETQAGKAELLLTPGVFFRLGDNGSATMISPSLIDTELRLDKGEAFVEAAELHPQNDIVIDAGGAKVRIADTGLYEIDADRDVVRVYSGQLDVDVNNHEIEVKNQHLLALNSASINPEKFKADQSEDALYQWSSLRSSYLAEANVDRAQTYEMGNWYGDGWDWDADYGSYTFIPEDGIFYSPFGWGFYSPFDVGYAPLVFYGHYPHHFDHDPHHWDLDGGHHEAHYYDHFDHGSYVGPGSGYYAGHYRGGEVAGGYRVQPGEGFHPGHGGGSFHGGPGGAVIGGAHGAHGAEGFHGGASFGGFHGMGGGGFHGGGGGHR